MAQRNPHWRESIGVVAPARTGSVRPGSGPVTGSTGPTGPAAVAEGLAALEALLDALPLGSMAFAEQVAAKLWPQPTPAEVQAIAALLEAKPHVRDAALRTALLGAVAARRRVPRLAHATAAGIADAVRLGAVAAEWDRLAEGSLTIAAQLRLAAGASAQRAAEAAHALLPDAEAARAEGYLAREMARLVEAAQGGGAAAALPAPLMTPEGQRVAAALATRRAEPSDALFVEAWAAVGLALRDLPRAAGAELAPMRAVLALVAARFDAAVRRMMERHARDPRATERMAFWNRLVRDARARIDLAAAAGPALAAPGPRAAADPASADAALVEHLQRVREKAQSLTGEVEPTGTTGVATGPPASGWLSRLLGPR